jgi:hypothetical protein
MRAFASVVVLSTVLVWSGPACAGWVIDEVVKGGREQGRHQMLLQANRMKTVVVDGGQPATAFVVDLDAETLTQIDYRERWYATTPMREFAGSVQGAMSGAMKEMEEALRNLPPEQRKMAEQMMAGRRPGGAPGADCREPRVEVRRTGPQATIAGYASVRHEVLLDGKPQSEVWLAKDLAAWRELDRQKLERFGQEMSRLSACSPGGGRGMPGADAAWRSAEEGFPTRTVHQGGTTVEVVKAEQRAIAPSEFQPPSGFARKTFQELMGGR